MRARRALRSAALLLAAAAGLALARPSPIVSPDQDQPRLNVAAPLPRAGRPISQDFVAGRDGLSAIEVLAVVYDDPPDSPAALTLRLLDKQGEQIGIAHFAQVAHNDTLRLTVPPQPDSAEQRYTLSIEASGEANRATVWAYSLDGYVPGLLRANGLPARGDLRFTTFTTLTWPGAARIVAAGLAQAARRALPLWLVLFAPGLLALGVLSRHSWAQPGGLRWGLALGLSLACLALLWLWAGVLGLRLSARLLWVLYGGLGLAWLALSVWRVATRRAALARPALADGLLIVILLVGYAARLLAARDLVLPPWVDSPHHFLIARLLAEGGAVPVDYGALLPVTHFTYHFGYHALLVTYTWLAGLSLQAALLPLGQLLNALVPLAAYALATGLTGRRRAGLAAAFFVACVSFFPGYYLAWGRYTQLTGLLLFAPALAALWRALQPPPAGQRAAQPVVLTAVLAAGLLVTHYRLLIFFALFALVALAAHARRRAAWLAGGGSAALGALLTLPWLLRLALSDVARLAAAPGELAAANAYNAFPFDYFTRPVEYGWLACAAVALAWGVLRRDRLLIVITAWLALTFALLNIGPGTWLVNNNSWAITLFIPGAVALGWAFDRLLALQSRVWAVAVQISLAVGLAYAGARGLPVQADVVRPVTVLVTASDLPALDWVRENTPAEAVFLVNAWPWLSRAWASPDAGAWLWLLTGRRTTLPPIDYTFDSEEIVRVEDFNQAAMDLLAEEVDSPQALALLRRAGVTHVFIGAKGGPLRPEAFSASPAYRVLYTNGAAWVFEFEGK